MKFLTVLLTSGIVFGQGIPVLPPGSNLNGVHAITITVSKQPVNAMVIALGSKIPGVTGYSTRLCNVDPVNPTVVSGGVAAQWIEGHGVPVVPIQVSGMIASAARIHSKLYKMADLTTQVSFYSAMLLGANFVKFANDASIAAKAARLAPVIIGHEADKAKTNLAQQLPDPTLKFGPDALRDDDVPLQPGACRTLLFLGSTDSKVLSVSGEIYGR